MSTTNIDITQLTLGQLAQIEFNKRTRLQLSEAHPEWDYISKLREKNSLARERRFLSQIGLGPSAFQWRNPGTANRSFPAGQKVGLTEHTAKYKEINGTIEVEQNVWRRAQEGDAWYDEPLDLEIRSKAISGARRMSIDAEGDGSGVVGTVLGTPTISAGRIVVTLATPASGAPVRGFVGWFEFQDRLNHYTTAGAAGTAPTVSSGTFDHWQVENRDRDLNQVTLSARDALDVELTVTVVGVATTNLFYRTGQPTIPDLTTAISDYGNLCEVMVGFQSLTANDGRTVHGMLMSGATAGSRFDAKDAPLDVSLIHKMMDKVSIAVGKRYRYKTLLSSHEGIQNFIESREDDRRFISIQDDKRGAPGFAYVYNEHTLKLDSSEFCPKNLMYTFPEAKGDEKVMTYWGTNFETIKIGTGADGARLKVSGGQYVNTIVMFLQAIGVTVNQHPASCGVLENFVLS